MNLELLRELQTIKVTDKDSAIMRCRFALEVFGHATLGKQDCLDYKIDIEEAAEDYGWIVNNGTLVYVVTMSETKSGPQVQFGDARPTRQSLNAIQGQRRTRH